MRKLFRYLRLYWCWGREAFFTREQKAALAGKIPMTKELFWGCLTVCRIRDEKKRFFEIWNKYPDYIKACYEGCERETTGSDIPGWKKAEKDSVNEP